MTDSVETMMRDFAAKGSEGDHHARPHEDVLAAMDSGPAGLSPEEAARRLRLDGRNELATAAARSPLMCFSSRKRS